MRHAANGPLLCEKVAECVCVRGNNSEGRPLFLSSGTCGCLPCIAPSFTCKSCGESLRKVPRVKRLREITGHVVTHDVRQAANVEGHDRSSAALSLHGSEGHVVFTARYRGDVGGVVEQGEFLAARGDAVPVNPDADLGP